MAAFGPPPSSTPREAVLELLKTTDLNSPRPSTLAPFEWEKLKLLQEGWPVRPQELTSVCPDVVRDKFLDPSSFRLSQEEFEAVHGERRLIRPYWDPVLANNRALRIKFIKALAARGLVSFRRRLQSTVGCFFVRKKDSCIRMVLDARRTNQCHKLPPHTALGSVQAWSALDFDLVDQPPLEDEIMADLETDRPELWSASGDLCDSFYQLTCEAMGEDFGFDYPESACVYDAEFVFEENRWVPVMSDELVFPAFVGLPMGWSWALWAMHLTTSEFVARSSTLWPDPLVVEDRRVAPPLA